MVPKKITKYLFNQIEQNYKYFILQIFQKYYTLKDKMIA